MKLDIFCIDDFIAANKCQEVTNPVFFNFDGSPTPDGLFSYDLFGFTDEERKNIFGYIDLKTHFIHPLIYLIMRSKMGSLGKILSGQKYAVIADKKIKIVDPDFEGAETGIDFIYDHFEEINWINELEEGDIESIDKKTRLKLFKSLKKNEFFITKWLVLPPYYRAASATNRSMGDSINSLYKELISKVRSLGLGFSFEIFGAETKLRIQNILKDIYLSTLSPLSGKNLILEKGKSEGELKGSGKNSMIRKHLLGKTTDWGASAVITAPENSRALRPEDKPVPFGYSAFPLATLLSLFQPFFLNFCVDYLEDYLVTIAGVFGHDIKNIDLGQFNSEKIEKMIKGFIKDPDNRFEPIEFVYTNKNNEKVYTKIFIFEFKTEEDVNESKNYVRRYFTITDLFFIAARSCLMDKHVYVTRYPVTFNQNIYPCKIKILSTAKTKEVYYKFSLEEPGFVFDSEYPLIPVPGSKKNDSKFYDVMICGNAYLASLGGDYDGDMLYMRGVFTQEANAEAERLVWAKTNILNAQGGPARALSEMSKECIMGLYSLTKEV